MRTPLACKLRVMISPWKSLPTFLKEPMLAMSLLLLCFEPATTAASMAIFQAEDDRRRTRFPRAGAQRRTSLWRLSCLARNGRKPRGRKSHQRRCGSDDRGAAGLRPDQAIKEATCVRVLNRNLGRRRGESRLSCTRGRNGSAQKEEQSAAKGGVVREVMIISGALHRPGYAGLAEMSAA